MQKLFSDLHVEVYETGCFFLKADFDLTNCNMYTYFFPLTFAIPFLKL